MAVILILVCSGLGFGSAVAALLLFDVSLFQAFALWMGCGFSAMLIAVLPLLLPQRQRYSEPQTERA